MIILDFHLQRLLQGILLIVKFNSVYLQKILLLVCFFFSYLDLNFEIIKRSGNCRYANCDDIRLVKLGLIALFSNFKLTTISCKHLEDISHAHMVCSV